MNLANYNSGSAQPSLNRNYILRHLKPVFVEIARNKQTTGLGHVTVQDLKHLRMVFPPDDILDAFNQIAQPLFGRSFNDLLESRTLAELCDTLLPKLLSGEIRVRDAEKVVGEAV